MEMHAVKGAGRDHTELGPVATVCYQLLLHIISDESNPAPHILWNAPGIVSPWCHQGRPAYQEGLR
ncbi:hypothetical protein BC834DRAFT_910727 [Gloeopeniophorella convolvens]|nr:hypothetical protein BC834DRAFT_910727 [Gloeopeniophorella convolvens]